MSTYNPYILGLALEDFQFEVKNWSGRIHENIEDLQYQLRLGAQATTNMRDLVSYIQAECETDTESVAESEQVLIESRSLLDEQSKRITQRERYIEHLRDTVHKHRLHWEVEFEEAGNWVSDASTALDAARTQLDTCRAEYHRAKQALETATENNRSTRQDYQRLQDAESKLATAVAHHRAAQAELERANARKESCGNAVDIMGDAVNQLQNLNTILQDIYRAYGEAESAQSSAESLQQDAFAANQAEIKLVDQAHTNTTQAEQAISTASQHMNRIVGLEQEAYTYADGTVSAIEHRVDKLRMVDFPDLPI